MNIRLIYTRVVFTFNIPTPVSDLSVGWSQVRVKTINKSGHRDLCLPSCFEIRRSIKTTYTEIHRKRVEGKPRTIPRPSPLELIEGPSRRHKEMEERIKGEQYREKIVPVKVFVFLRLVHEGRGKG